MRKGALPMRIRSLRRLARWVGSATRLSVEQLEERCVLSSAAVIPAPASIPYWQTRYAQLDAAPRTDPQVVFLGDSIFDEFANGPGAAVWNAQLAPLHAADYAIGASMTQNLLWQIQQGQMDGLSPR